MKHRLRIAGVYLRKVEMVLGRGRVRRTVRAYVVFEYAGKPMGKLAISEKVFEQMRADGIPLLAGAPSFA